MRPMQTTVSLSSNFVQTLLTLVFTKSTHVSAVRCFHSVFAQCARQSWTAMAQADFSLPSANSPFRMVLRNLLSLHSVRDSRTTDSTWVAKTL